MRAMRDSILHFVNLMRGSDVRISTSEVIDALAGLAHIELLSRDQFRTLLRTTLVKRAEDLAEFERLFALVFKALGDREEPGDEPSDEQTLSEEVEAIVDEANGLLSLFLRQLLLGGLPTVAAALPSMARHIRLSEMHTPFQAAFFEWVDAQNEG